MLRQFRGAVSCALQDSSFWRTEDTVEKEKVALVVSVHVGGHPVSGLLRGLRSLHSPRPCLPRFIPDSEEPCKSLNERFSLEEELEELRISYRLAVSSGMFG